MGFQCQKVGGPKDMLPPPPTFKSGGGHGPPPPPPPVPTLLKSVFESKVTPRFFTFTGLVVEI